MTVISNEEFAKRMMLLAHPAEQFRPTVTYDPDGDCIEFLAKPDPFYAERVDDRLLQSGNRRSYGITPQGSIQVLQADAKDDAWFSYRNSRWPGPVSPHFSGETLVLETQSPRFAGLCLPKADRSCG